MDLISGYLLIILMIFAANIAFLAGNYKISNVKLIAVSLGFSIVSFALMNVSLCFKEVFTFLLAYFSYYFLVVAVLIFGVIIYYRGGSENNLSKSICLLGLILLVSTVLLACQSDLTFFDSIIYSFVAFLVMFFVYMINKLLVHAKIAYPIIIGEFMALASILVFIFAMTYNSTLTLDYSMFSSFLILTPTYQLVYVIIGLVVVMIMGLLYNDFRRGNS